MTIQTNDFRYTEWLTVAGRGEDGRRLYNWSDIVGQELYYLDKDFYEDNNVAKRPKFQSIVDGLQIRMRQVLKLDQ